MSTFFVPQKESNEADTMIASFRGRALRGASIALPEGYSGWFSGSGHNTKRHQAINSWLVEGTLTCILTRSCDSAEEQAAQ